MKSFYFASESVHSLNGYIEKLLNDMLTQNYYPTTGEAA